MKKKEFTVNGATILVLQVDDWLNFSMQIKSLRFFHCATYKGKIDDVTEDDAIEIWNRYHTEITQKDEAWIAKLFKRRKTWQKRNKSSSDSSKPLIREIRP